MSVGEKIRIVNFRLSRLGGERISRMKLKKKKMEKQCIRRVYTEKESGEWAWGRLPRHSFPFCQLLFPPCLFREYLGN